MKFRLVPPHITREKDLFGIPPKRLQAFVVTVDSTSRNPVAAYKYELAHVWLFYICSIIGCLMAWAIKPSFWFVGISLYGLLYQVPFFRFYFETIAFGAQASLSMNNVDEYAEKLSNQYKLKRIDYYEAKKEIARWKEIFGEYS